MTEIKGKIEEIFDDLKGRIKNPLILSFVIVWIYHHWTFVYILFTMDYYSVDERVYSLKRYISEHNSFYGMVFLPLIHSFVSLTAYYLIANISQAIKIYVGKRLNASMLAKVDVGNYHLKK